jgi:hypothetical protein
MIEHLLLCSALSPAPNISYFYTQVIRQAECDARTIPKAFFNKVVYC